MTVSNLVRNINSANNPVNNNSAAHVHCREKSRYKEINRIISGHSEEIKCVINSSNRCATVVFMHCKNRAVSDYVDEVLVVIICSSVICPERLLVGWLLTLSDVD